MEVAIQRIQNEVKKNIKGKDSIIFQVLCALLAGGHVLLEDIPGVGKTTLALSFSQALALSYKRVQFTPDVLPSDISGFSIYDKTTATMKYQPGNVFHNLFLADELNRASSRTQSALLEAMEEGQVTVDGKTYKLPEPFITFATQNPSGAAGTSLLPDSQMDRFMIKVSMGYPSAQSEVSMVLSRQGNNDQEINQVCTASEMKQMQEMAKNTFIHEQVVIYIVNLINATRQHPMIKRGASPRATIALTDMAKAFAFVKNQNFVSPDEVKSVFAQVIAHRIILSTDAEMKGVSVDDVLKQILSAVKPPKV